ncbi:MAG: GNAT family N-acetyltransferase [Rhodocyclaceae bacterium]|nr:GNAT family N-acetyltransferase [Rhodocyclaceae bacterium]
MPLSIRPARVEDVNTLRGLYRAAVLALGPAAYSPAQVAAWQAFAGHADFEAFILDVHTWVAVRDDAPIGFCGVDDEGHVASLYLAPEMCGAGLGEALLRAVLARHPRPSSGRYHAEASAFSLPVFLRCGFTRADVEQVERDGVAFERQRVVRPAIEATASDPAP